MHAESPVASAADALRAMWDQVRAVRDGDLGELEVERAKRVYESQFVRRLEDMEGQANFLAEWEALGDERGCTELRSCIGMIRDRITVNVGKARTLRAADKDHHSVNFGLMNTYRQQWTPLLVQAGKLVKTIPLAEGGTQVLRQTQPAGEALQQGGEEEQSLHHERAEFNLTCRGGDHGQGPKQDQLRPIGGRGL